MSDYRLLKKYRLRNRDDFDQVFRRRRSVADGLLVLYACRNQLDHSRIGLVVSRKIGGAVARNRWKRLIREAFRLNRCRLPVSLDIVVIPRQGVDPQLARLERSLEKLTDQINKRLSDDEAKDVTT